MKIDKNMKKKSRVVVGMSQKQSPSASLRTSLSLRSGHASGRDAAVESNFKIGTAGQHKKLRVIVGMSGGVDSSVAAALLKEQGYDVVGVFLKFWHEPKKKGVGICENKCCSSESQSDARQVANILKIPFYTIDVSKEFKKRVVDYFIDEYKNGNTPNPCVECNKWIKFGLFMDKAKKMGADYLATGHYVRVVNKSQISNPKTQTNSKFKNSNYKLLTAKDSIKDQSYFLWKLDQKQLAKILFPIGEYNKPQIRELAKKFKLPVFEKKDSQEVCFISGTLQEFLQKHVGETKGSILSVDNKKIGMHNGLIPYTIGQRKGLGLSGGPYYVVDKNIKKNVLIVSNSEKDLLKGEMVVKKIHWILGQAPKLPLNCRVKIRYLSEFLECRALRAGSSNLKVIFKNSVRAITPGQSAVFYRDNEVLGGGIIK